jgi:hypothetical protein
MKAYSVSLTCEPSNAAIVTAPTPGKAKVLALRTTTGRRFLDLRATRVPELDTDDDRVGPYTGAECLDGCDCSYWGIPVRFW